MSVDNTYHTVKLIPNANGMGFDCAVMWEKTILCLCPNEEWAKAVAYTLDKWQDYCRKNGIDLLPKEL